MKKKHPFTVDGVKEAIEKMIQRQDFEVKPTKLYVTQAGFEYACKLKGFDSKSTRLKIENGVPILIPKRKKK